jgi:hypothetical protein
MRFNKAAADMHVLLGDRNYQSKNNRIIEINIRF